jgi:hypothetical protein
MTKSLVASLWIAGALAVGLISNPASALYDPKPRAPATLMEGEWVGSLTYADYADKSRRVTLPTKLVGALQGPDRLSFHFIYDDGPSKIVHSYDDFTISLDAKTAMWGEFGSNTPTAYAVTETSPLGDGGYRVVLEARSQKKDRPPLSQLVIEIDKDRFSMERKAGDDPAHLTFSNSYSFKRVKAAN